MNTVFPMGLFEVSTPRKWAFCLYFSSIHDYWHQTPDIRKYISRGAKWRDVKNVFFSSSNYEKWLSALT